MSLIVWTDSINFTSIFVSINHVGVRFLLELNVDYPFSSKDFFFKVANYPFLVD